MKKHPVRLYGFFCFLPFCLILISCTRDPGSGRNDYTIETVAESRHLWTGIAVSAGGRMFVNFPRWSPDIPMSVAELTVGGDPAPFPDPAWNSWKSDEDPANRFVCVQSVYVDADEMLWVLDTGFSIYDGGVIPGGAKLVAISLLNGEVKQVIRFDTASAPPGSYLNDVRIDTEREYAYITDSGLGAILAVDLSGPTVRRLLAGDPSVHSEGITLTIEGTSWVQADGSRPDIHADGIGYDAENDLVYYQALTGRTLYRLKGEYLRDETLSEQELADRVERVGETGAADGMAFDRRGRLLLTALEFNGITVLEPQGTATLAVSDSLLQWPDSIAPGPDDSWYVTASRLHRTGETAVPFRLLKISRR
ncbi:hypothetical protein JXO52_09635 [bacterium]|nr:hypothetical protein [bacterium]